MDMTSAALKISLLFATGLLLSACEYQMLPDDDPHGPHHTELQRNGTPDIVPDPEDV